MNILFVANRFPYPPHRGDKLKIFNLARQLSKKHNLYLITFIQDKNDYQYLDELGKYFRKIDLVYLPQIQSAMNCLSGVFSSKPFQVSYFKSREFEERMNDLITNYDIDAIHTQHLRMSQYTSGIKDIPTILDLPDAYSLYWKRRSKLCCNYFKKKLELLEHKKVLEYEKVIKKFDMTLVCSHEDQSLLKNEHDYESINILPNGIDTSTFYSDCHDYRINDRIIFTGNMDYFPNSDAAVYFSKEIFPEILKKFPDVKFYIVGQKPPQKVKELQSDNIIVTGFVDSIADEYKYSSIAVSPVRVGAGTLNKVLEPMAMGVPVVSSPIGFEGIGASHGEEILLAENKNEFIKSVTNLLSDQNYRRCIGEGGKNHVTQNFSWEKVADTLENYFYNICGQEQYTGRFAMQKVG